MPSSDDRLESFGIYQLACQLFDDFIARGEARESRGRYRRSRHLLPAEVKTKRLATLDQIIGGLTNPINTLEQKRVAKGN